LGLEVESSADLVKIDHLVECVELVGEDLGEGLHCAVGLFVGGVQLGIVVLYLEDDAEFTVFDLDDGGEVDEGSVGFGDVSDFDIGVDGV
jgi:hypothetical protein